VSIIKYHPKSETPKLASKNTYRGTNIILLKGISESITQSIPTIAEPITTSCFPLALTKPKTNCTIEGKTVPAEDIIANASPFNPERAERKAIKGCDKLSAKFLSRI